MPDNTQRLDIQVSAGLTADTKLLIDDDSVSMKSLFTSNIRHGGITYGLDNQARIVNQHILQVPNEIPTRDIAKVEFSNGLQLECTPNTLVFTIDGWKSILTIKPEDNILGAIFSPDTGIKGKIFHVVSGDLMKKLIPVNVYFFATENQNILIPHPESDAITFICIHQ